MSGATLPIPITSLRSEYNQERHLYLVHLLSIEAQPTDSSQFLQHPQEVIDFHPTAVRFKETLLQQKGSQPCYELEHMPVFLVVILSLLCSINPSFWQECVMKQIQWRSVHNHEPLQSQYRVVSCWMHLTMHQPFESRFEPAA